MNDSLGVAGRQRIGYLDANVEDLLHLHRLSAHPVLQAHTFQLLHDDEGMSVQVLDIVDDADARVVQLRGGAGLAHEALQRLAVVDQIFGNELQRNVAAQARVFRFVNHAHATAAKLSHNVVVGDCLADHVEDRSHVGGMLGRASNPVNPMWG